MPTVTTADREQAERIAIIFDGEHWFVRRVASSAHDLDRDEMVYRCDQPVSGPHERLEDVPAIAAALAESLERHDKARGDHWNSLHLVLQALDDGPDKAREMCLMRIAELKGESNG